IQNLSAQEDSASNKKQRTDLMAMLEEEAAAPQKEIITATFKTTRIANGHSIENLGKGVLDFRINHRFGRINAGFKEFFGLDDAVTRIGFDYGVTDWLMIGIGRSSFMKEYDGFLKARLLKQKSNGGSPVSVSYVGAVSLQTQEVTIPPGTEYYFSNRLAYINQVLVASKINQWLSLQLMPTHLHYNLVDFNTEKNDVIAIGLGGRVKLSNRIALTGEYYSVTDAMKRSGAKNSLSLCIEIETEWHVF